MPLWSDVLLPPPRVAVASQGHAGYPRAGCAAGACLRSGAVLGCGLADDCKQAAAVPFGCSTPFCLLLAAVWMIVPTLLLRLSLSGHGQEVGEFTRKISDRPTSRDPGPLGTDWTRGWCTRVSASRNNSVEAAATLTLMTAHLWLRRVGVGRRLS